MKDKLYKADELMHVLENTSLTDIDQKILNAKNHNEQAKWWTLYNLKLSNSLCK